MIDKLKVSRVVNADTEQCHALVADVESYGSWVSDLREVSVGAVSYTHLTLPTNREV